MYIIWFQDQNSELVSQKGDPGKIQFNEAPSHPKAF